MNKKQAQKWLYQQHKYLKYSILLLSLFSLILSLTAIFFAFYSRETIDAAINNNQNRFVTYAIIISSIMVVNLLFLALNQYFKVSYKAKVDRKLKDHLFNKIIHAESRYTNDSHSGVYMTHLESDVEHIAEGLIEVIPRIVFYVIRFLGAFILLFLINQMFAILFLGLGVFMFLISRLLSKEMKRRHHKLQQTHEKARSYLQESIENITVIKTFQAEQKITKFQDEKQYNVYVAKKHKNQLSIFVSSGLNIFFAFGYAFAIIFGAYQLQFGLTVGSLLAMIQLVQHIQSPFSGLSQLVPKYYQMLASTERVMDIDSYIDEKIENVYDTHSFESLVARDLTFSYVDEQEVIKHLSFNIKQGEMVHIIGKSGKGKTTLLKLLLGLIDKKQGELVITTQHHQLPVSFETRSFFSYVPQENLMMSGSIRENLNLYDVYPDQRLHEVLKTCLLYDEIMSFTGGLDHVLGERGKGLSEGQIQRLAIARAILKESPILLLDEITSALDQKTEKQIMENIKNMKRLTCLIISHRDLEEGLISQSIIL